MPIPQHDHDATVESSRSPADAPSDDQTRVQRSDPTVVTQPDGLPVIAGYDLTDEIARGGMGAVYRARDTSLDREVAVKVMLPGMDAAAFVRESRIAARLPHPGVPPVHALGTLPDGRPFLAMKLIRGDTLDSLLRARTDRSADRAQLLAAFEQMCQAVGYAHAQGIVHRDLKPSNIMVGAFGEVQVMDWGLAKVVGAADPEADAGGTHSDDAAATVAGQIKGTPAYMAPEQARGEPVDARADVFALGGLLAAILTGQPPFTGNSVLDTIIRASKGEVDRAFERLDASGADDELVRLAKHCLAARADDRPANGTAVTEAVAAYRAGVDERLRRAEQERAAADAKADEQKKRRRVQLALAGVVLAVVVGGAVAANRVQRQRDEDRLAASREQAEAEKRLAAEQVAAEKRQAEIERAALAESDRQKRLTEAALGDMQTNFGIVAQERNRAPVAALWFAGAAAIGEAAGGAPFANHVRFDLARRGSVVPLRAFEFGEEVFDLQLHPDARYLIARGKGGRFVLWDVGAEKPLPFPGEGGAVTAAVWSGDGARLAVARGTAVEVWDADRGRRRNALAHTEPVVALGFRADGERLAVAGTSARVWDCTADDWAAPALKHPGPVAHLVFSPAGDVLVSSCADNVARAFPLAGQDWPGPRTCPHLVGGFPGIWPTRIAPVFAGRLLLTVSSTTAVSAWDPAADRRLWTYAGYQGVNSLAASPDGRIAVVGEFTQVMSLNAVTGGLTRADRNHKHSACGLGYLPDGRRMITASFDRTVRVTDGRTISPELMHQDGVQKLSVARTRNVFATAQFDGLVRVWGYEDDAVRRIAYDGPGESPDPTATTADGALCLPATAGPEAQVFSTADGRAAGPPLPLPGRMHGSLFLPDGRSVLLWGSQASAYTGQLNDRNGPPQCPGWLERRDWKTGTRLLGTIAAPGTVVAAAVSPSGRDVVIACATGQLFILDLETGGQKRSVTIPTGPGTWWYLLPVTVAFHPTDDRCVVSGLGRWVFHIDTAKGTVLHRLDAGEKSTAAEFAPGGERIVASATGKEVRFWDAASGKSLPPLVHPDWVFRVVFTADGRYMATTGRDNRARVWDWRSGELVAALEHPDEVYDARFSPDARWLFTIGRDGRGRFWEWRAGKPAGPVLEFPPTAALIPSISGAYTPDGRRLVCAVAGLLAVDVFVSPETADLGAPDRLRLGRLLSGQGIGANSNLVNMTSAEWVSEWRRFRAGHPARLPLPPAVTPDRKVEMK